MLRLHAGVCATKLVSRKNRQLRAFPCPVARGAVLCLHSGIYLCPCIHLSSGSRCVVCVACDPTTDTVQQHQAACRSTGDERHLRQHPHFPNLNPSCPLLYVLTMKACLSHEAAERPSFEEIQTLLQDIAREVATGTYVNSGGAVLVRMPLCLSCAGKLGDQSKSDRVSLLCSYASTCTLACALTHSQIFAGGKRGGPHTSGPRCAAPGASCGH